MNVVSQERMYFISAAAEKYGKVYASVLGRMCQFEHNTQNHQRMAKRLANAKIEGMRLSAVLILKTDEYNEIETEKQAEELVKLHRSLYREAAEKDEKDRESWGI
ncbi:hypothetical protein ACFRCI_17320 [Streptomyces sp. NPDC056638]|uniref:hypothetical protein n=1 Tax=Streptomyces sp. NPDC056638 TaxID=3345887 RepID=UPI0036897468